MAETNFTPGPWDLLAGCYTPENGYFWMVQVADRTTAYAFEEANAYLTAAGPDLYEALQGAIGALEYSVDCARDDGNNSDIDFAQSKLDAALKALAKARGEA